jgi:putative DNA primase/helicase
MITDYAADYEERGLPCDAAGQLQPQDDVGNAKRFAHWGAGRIGYSHSRGWMRYTGTHWQRDDMGLAQGWAITTASRITAEAMTLPDTTTGNEKQSAQVKMQKWCESSRFTGRIQAMLALSQSDPAIRLDDTKWDASPEAINTASGLVDLRTLDVQPHHPAQMCSRVTPGAWLGKDWKPEASKWLDHLAFVAAGDATMPAYLQWAIGCSLVGAQRTHVVFFAFGGGGNGKGTMFRGLASAFGEYVMRLADGLVEQRDGSKPHPTELADLFGRRLVYTPEITKGARLDIGKVNGLSGGDPIKARYIAKDFFEFEPSHTLWLCANDKPVIRSNSDGIWRRMRLIPFSAKATPDMADDDIDAKISADRDAVLTWAIKGAHQYLTTDAAPECHAVTQASADYRADEDVIGRCLNDICVFDFTQSTPKKSLAEAIAEWFDAEGIKPPSPRDVKLELEKRRIAEAPRERGQPRRWAGLRLMSQDHVEPKQASMLAH